MNIKKVLKTKLRKVLIFLIRFTFIQSKMLFNLFIYLFIYSFIYLIIFFYLLINYFLFPIIIFFFLVVLGGCMDGKRENFE